MLSDALDRLTQMDVLHTPVAVQLAPDYGERQDGLRESLAISVNGAADTTTSYGYDDLLRLTSLTQTPAGSSQAAAKRVTFAYMPDGRFDRIERFTDAAGTQLVAASQYGYDPLSRLTSLVHQGPDEALATYFWTYDAAGRIAKITGSGPAADYAYLDDGQLDTATYSGTSAPADEDFDYDANGNRTGGGFVIDAYNRIASDGAFNYIYDAEGNRVRRINLATDDYEEYTWDHRNRLVSVGYFNSVDTLLGSVEYAYDFQNQLIARSVDEDGLGTADPITQYFVHDQGQIVLILDESGAVTNRLLWGPQTDLLLSDEQVDPTTGATDALFWALGDHQNTVRDLALYDVVTGETTIAEHRNYTAFGTPLDAWSVDTLFGAQGRLYDPATGLYNHLNRWRDALQWLSEDPIGFAAGDPNTRRITGNDPINRVDPSGLADVNYPAMRAFLERYGLQDEVQVHHVIRQEFFDGGHELGPWLKSHGLTRDDLDNLKYLPNAKAVENGYSGNQALHLGGHTKDSANRVLSELQRIKRLEELGQFDPSTNQVVKLDKAQAAAAIKEVQRTERLALRAGEAQLHSATTLATRRAGALARRGRAGRFVLPDLSKSARLGSAISNQTTRARQYIFEGISNPAAGFAAEAVAGEFQYQSLGTYIDESDAGMGLALYLVPAPPTFLPLAQVADLSRPPLIPVANGMNSYDRLEGGRQSDFIEIVYHDALSGHSVSPESVRKARAYMEARVTSLLMRGHRDGLPASDRRALETAFFAGIVTRDPEVLYNKYILKAEQPTFREIQELNELRKKWPLPDMSKSLRSLLRPIDGDGTK